MIVDSFVFFNEYDMLESRLDYLYDSVDLFVIVECSHTHSGNPKPFNFVKNKNRYKRFEDKIFAHPFIFDNDVHNLNFQVPEEQKLSTDNSFWKIENLQRNHITEVINILPDDALVMISDLDEIPNKRAIQIAKENIKIGNFEFAILEQELYYYDLMHKLNINWPGTAVSTAKAVKRFGTQWFRTNRYTISPRIYDGGWHMSYFMDAEKIAEKIMNLAHQENNKEEFTNISTIERRIRNDDDIYGRTEDKFDIQNDLTRFPADMLKSFSRFVKHKAISP